MLRPQLKTFLTVCETASFSKAAAALYLTPSAVLQQIRTLERELGAELFERSSKGVTLTPAGDYLHRRALTLQQINDEIHRDIHALASADNRICIGSSMLEKVRLLYELWVLFSEEEARDCGIQMVNIDVAHNIPPETDLIESINSSVAWMREWDFLEICRVPFGFALSNTHPLSKKERLTLEDLRGLTVLTINDGTCDEVARLLELLRRGRVAVDVNVDPGTNILWESAFRRNALLVPQCWSDILINMTVVPFEYEFSLPYGIFHRPHPQPTVQRFLDFIRRTYNEGNSRGIVPVLA